MVGKEGVKITDNLHVHTSLLSIALIYLTAGVKDMGLAA